MLRHCLLLLLIFCQWNILNAEPQCHFKHYTTEDGLPQYTIMDMLQDKNGFMWFGTWDGISKFDGYTFKNFKAQPSDTYLMKSNRIAEMASDKFGRIWFTTYDGERHCFDPYKLKFWGPQLIKNLSKTFKVTRSTIQPSGRVWMISNFGGCILIKDSLFNNELFDQESGKIKGEAVNAVIEDNQLNQSWLLTNNGITMVSHTDQTTSSYFYERATKNRQERQEFFSGVNLGKTIMFGSQNGRLWQYEKKSGSFKLIQAPVLSGISKIIPVSNDLLILVTQNLGFMLYNRKLNSFEIYNSNTQKVLANSDNIGETFLIHNRDLWFNNDNIGIYRFDIPERKIQFYKVTTDDPARIVFPPKTMVFEDINGRLWIQPKGGGFALYNPIKKELSPFYNATSASNWRFSNIIHSACTDRQGNLWMCTRSHGLEKIVFDQNNFQSLKVNKDLNSVTANDVRAVFEDRDHNIWVGTKDSRLTIFDKYKKKIGQVSISGALKPEAYLPGMVYSIAQDNENNIWLGTKGNGLYRLSKKNNSLNFSIEHFSYNASDVYSISDNSVYSIFQDSYKNIWVGTYGGGLNLIKRLPDGKLRFMNHRNHLKNFPFDIAYRVRIIQQTAKGNICVGTTGGLLVFSPHFTNPENIQFSHYSHKPGDNLSLSNNDVHSICTTKNGETYLATFGGGLNKVESWDEKGFPNQFSSFTTNDGLPSDVTLAVMEDEYGALWVSNENNLSKIDPKNRVVETFAEVKRLMATSNFSEASNFVLKSNFLAFGYSHGILYFSPRQLNNNLSKPNIVFSNLQLFNKNVSVGTEDSPLQFDINETKELVLKHNQNFISIEYAAIDFVDPENILYACKLDGFDKEWNYVQKRRIANYTNLPKGKYTFRVKSTNSEGAWTENERTLSIEVLPSFWETIWAYILYLLILGGIIYGTVQILFTIYRLRGNVELEKRMSDMKMRFFTDISHEIRTPLTMVTAPVDHLLNDEKTPDSVKKHLKTISQNTNRILRLVNQILDFRKIEFTHIKVQEVEIAPFVEDICNTFSEISDNQHTKFKFINHAGSEKIWLDPDCLDKIVSNLLSNAFKYTPPGKSIKVIITSDDKSISVAVADHGRGLSKERQKNLFVRFNSFNEDKSKPSTGIGLSMVKELAEKHGAKVTVESEEGKGSTFTVTFLKGSAHFDQNVEIIGASLVTVNSPTEEPITQTLRVVDFEKENILTSKSKYSVMIVEDDSELRQFIKDTVADEYDILEAEDGQDGWEKAQKYTPDFIVSDIMMPRMDGIALLQRLKGDIHTSHIPVVLLTAKTTIDSKLEGLSYGADDYITKPFSVQYFKARIANLIQQRILLQELFRSGISKEPLSVPESIYVNPQDEHFIEKLVKIIEENIEDFEFTIEELGQQMLMSRSVFFKKVKSLTGLAPVEFVRDVKMNRAAQLLTSGRYMVKETAYMVGISDTKYFTRCFKNKFGITPLEYKNAKTHQ